MELYNTKTRKKEPIDDPEVVKQAVLSGTHSFAAGSEVTVKSPEGELGTVPSKNITQALQAGYEVETPSQRAVREYVEQNKGLSGAAKVAAGQFADEALLGLPELIMDKTADPLEVAKKEALKKEYDLANTTGGVLGFAASMLTGGPLFKAGSEAGAKATAIAAEKLGVNAAGEVGKRTVNKMAKEIAAKTAGGAVEGAVISAPHAITEAALGDPEDAAETLIAGAGIGSVIGGTVPLAKGLFNLTKSGTEKAASIITQQQETAETLAARLGKVFTGVDDDAILHYAKNADRVNAAPTVEALKNEIDDVVLRARDSVDIAKEKAFQIKTELDDAYKATLFDMSRKRAPENLADDILGALENEKATLGSLSEQADDALVRSGATFKKKDLLSLVDSIGKGVGAGKKGALIGEEAVAAVTKLKGLRDRIEVGLDDVVDAVTLRDVLRQVRSDINFNQAAGEFNDTLTKLRKNFTSKVSGALKDASPEYAAYMERMAGLSSSLDEVSKAFGTREKALASLNGMMSVRGKLKNDALNKFGELTGRNFQADLEDFKRAKDLLELSKRQDIRKDILPEFYKKYEDAQSELAKAISDYEPIRRLGPDSTQNAIRQQGFKNPSIENRKAFEEISKRAGKDYLTLFRDRAVLDKMMAETTNGSRKAVMFGALGGMIGGWPGSAAGTVVGGAMDMYGGRILKKMIDSTKNVNGLLYSEQAMKKAAEKLDSIPSLLKEISKKKPAPAKTLSTGALIRFLDGEVGTKKELSLDERIKKLNELNEKTSDFISNPNLIAERIGAISSGISSNGAPMIGDAMNKKMMEAIMYIHSQMPKPPKPKNAFAPKVQWRPSDYDLSKFEKKLQVVNDPFSIFEELRQGTLTKSHVEALQAVYPGIHRMMINKIGEAAMNDQLELPYNERVKLGLVLGEPLDDSSSPQSVLYYQQAYATQDQTQENPQDVGGQFKAQVNVAEGVETETDRLANRT